MITALSGRKGLELIDAERPKNQGRNRTIVETGVSS